MTGPRKPRGSGAAPRVGGKPRSRAAAKKPAPLALDPGSRVVGWGRRAIGDPRARGAVAVVAVLALGVALGTALRPVSVSAPPAAPERANPGSVTIPAVPATSEPEPADAEPSREEPVPTAPAAPAPDALASLLPPPSAPPIPPPPPAPKGTPAWRADAVPFSAPAGKPLIAIVIDDMGPDRVRSDRVVKLKAPLTLSWLPYARDLPARTRAARAAGHELLVHMPMEPSVKADPGPDALRVSLATPEIARTLTAALGAFDGYVGINNHMGSRFTERTEAMRPVIEELRRRGLLWLDSRTTPKSVGSALAVELNVPKADRDVFLDNVQSVSAVRDELVKLEEIARTRGKAVAIGHPHDTTIEALSAWLPTLQAKGFAQAPISALVTTKSAK